MQFYEHLYMGEKAAPKRFSILQGLRENKNQPQVYVITFPQEGNNLLDIYPSQELQKPWHRKNDPVILGIALGYEDALELAGTMVSQAYKETGGFDMKGWLLTKRR